MTKFGGILIDFDSVIQPSVDLEGRLLLPAMPESQREFRDTLDELVASGFPIAYESSLESRALGSCIFRENLSCDAYIGESSGNDEIDMRLEIVQENVKNSNQFIYICNSSNRIQVAIGLGYKCMTSKALVDLRHELLSQAPEARRSFTHKSFLKHLEKVAIRTKGLLLPMLPARFVTNSEIASGSARWNSVAKPLLKMITPPKFDERTGFQYFVPYYSNEASDQLGFRLWKKIKDWNGYESGPNPNLIDLNFVAATMAAGIWDQGDQAISFIPANPATRMKPAAASNQLSQRIAHFCGLPWLQLITRYGHQIFEAAPTEIDLQRYTKVAVIDDQLTKGVSMTQGIEIMSAHSPKTIFSPTVWSRSARRN